MPLIERVLLIAPDGMLGRAWKELLEARRIPFVGLRYPEFDLTDRGAIDALDLAGVDVVVNCAGWTDVDGAEDDEPTATAVNGHGVASLAERCARAERTLVHYSTDYVFDGQASHPYPVDAATTPVNAYGRSKRVGEVAVVATGVRHLLVRTSWLYAPWGHNFVKTMARLARERDTLRVVDDQRGRPTSAEHLARTSLALVARGAVGTFHVTDGGECSWFDLARSIVQAVRPACFVEPCSSDEFPRRAERPRYSVLDTSATRVVVGELPHWRENVAAVLERLDRPG